MGYDLASDAAGDWRTTNGSRYRGVGVGTATTGYRAGLILIDLVILVHGFRSGGPSLGHWLLAVPLGTLATYLLHRSARRYQLQNRA